MLFYIVGLLNRSHYYFNNLILVFALQILLLQSISMEESGGGGTSFSLGNNTAPTFKDLIIIN